MGDVVQSLAETKLHQLHCLKHKALGTTIDLELGAVYTSKDILMKPRDIYF